MKMMFIHILEQLLGFIECLISPLPGPIGSKLRYFFWASRLKEIGRRVYIGVGVKFYSPKHISIGNNCWIDDYTILTAGSIKDEGRVIYRKVNPDFHGTEGVITIGDEVHIAPFVMLQGHGGLQIGDSLTIASGAKIYTLSHHYKDLTQTSAPGTIMKFSSMAPANEQALICSPVVIGDGAAVGLNSVVLPGSTIGENSWLGAMSILRGKIEPNCIASSKTDLIIKSRDK